jgi:hypothetical protein
VAGEQLAPSLRERRPPPKRELRQAALRRCWPAWFAGCDLKVLARTSSDVTFYNALGIAVLLLSCLGGFAAYFAISYVLEDQTAAIGIGIAWAVLMSCAVERLLLQVAGSRKHLWALAVAIAPRVLLSILIGFILAEPLLLKINEPEINAFIAKEQRAEKRSLIQDATNTYDETIKEKEGQLKELREQVPKIEGRLSNLIALSGCAAAALPACAAGEAGCDPACQRYAGKAMAEQDKLRNVQADNAERQPALETSLGNWRGKRGEDENGGRSTITDSDGLMARIEALGGLSGAHTSVMFEVWILRFFFICLDLLPLAIKTTRILSSRSPYEMRMAAARERDGLAAEAAEAFTDVARQQIREQARADKRVIQAEIAAHTDQRIYGINGDAVPDYVPDYLVPDESSSGLPFDEFVGSIQVHEQRPVEVPEELRRHGLIGLALISGMATLALLWSSAAGAALGAAGWLLFIALGMAIVLCAYTRGFHEAPAWAMRPILFTFIAGLCSPICLLLSVL